MDSRIHGNDEQTWSAVCFVSYFPFSAVVGQQTVKTALLLLAIDPRLGGLCISGPRGSAKSTLARSLAELLPEGAFINLPLGCSEEALIGSLNLQRVLDQQQVEFQPGLLQHAHRGVLYVDEVNLLADHLVDQLLDVSASGINRIERDGISHQHDARFLLVGTMNPDEGELRSQFQDRFGLAVALSGQHSRAERIEIVRQREQFDDDPAAFCHRYQAQQQALADELLAARRRLPSVQCDEGHREIIAERCTAAQVEGLRADIVWCRAAKSHAAWQGRVEVTLADLEAVQELVLLHRRKTPPEPPSAPSEPPPFSRPPEQNQTDKQTEAAGDWGGMAREQSQPSAAVRRVDLPELPRSANPAPQGKRSQKTHSKPNWFATVVANRGIWPWQSLAFQRARQRPQRLHVVLLDRSASTLGESAFAQAKGVVAGIARQAYLARQQLLVIGFGNQEVTGAATAPARTQKSIAVSGWLDRCRRYAAARGFELPTGAHSTLVADGTGVAVGELSDQRRSQSAEFVAGALAWAHIGDRQRSGDGQTWALS
ncbi:MAG: ATP-binding protein [Gammaproteobacteria bacterium]|nr:ATP-binding protein [Gammaproteobacteria bacterium]